MNNDVPEWKQRKMTQSKFIRERFYFSSLKELKLVNVIGHRISYKSLENGKS